MSLTQEQLAALVGVRRETIMRLEKAQYNPSLKLAVDISRAVGAPIEDIFLFDERAKAARLPLDRGRAALFTVRFRSLPVRLRSVPPQFQMRRSFVLPA